MAHYIEVDSEQFKSFLIRYGFSETVSNNEVVFTKAHSLQPNLVVKVYTSIRVGKAVARDVGKDAVRVVAIFDDGKKSFGVFKGKRIYRTTSQDSVHDRVFERIDAAFARCDEWLLNSVKRTVHNELPPKTPQQDNRQEPVGNHVGAIGDELRLLVNVIKRKVWGSRYLFTFQSDNSDTFIYWSDKDLLQVGEMYSIRGVVKGHNTFCGVKQTELMNVFGKRVVV